MGTLDGRVALVTGAGRGFGRAIALALGRDGARVVVNYRTNHAAAAEVVEALGQEGGQAVALGADVAQEDQVRRLVDDTLTRLGGLDILVNNAGVMVHGPFVDIAVARYEEMFAVNVRGTLLCTRYALAPMLARGYGRIINLSSQLAQRPIGTGGFAAYAATKGAVEAFTRAMAQEVGSHGVTVNAIAPGGIETDMSRAVMTPEYRRHRLEELPLRRLGRVEDVAYCVRFLAAAESGYLTGQVLHPSGGWVMS